MTWMDEPFLFLRSDWPVTRDDVLKRNHWQWSIKIKFWVLVVDISRKRGKSFSSFIYRPLSELRAEIITPGMKEVIMLKDFGNHFHRHLRQRRKIEERRPSSGQLSREIGSAGSCRWSCSGNGTKCCWWWPSGSGEERMLLRNHRNW